MSSLTSQVGWGFHDPLAPFGDGLVRGGAPPRAFSDGAIDDDAGADGIVASSSATAASAARAGTAAAVYTNAELVALFEPTASTLPYVWDTFGWDQCVAT